MRFRRIACYDVSMRIRELNHSVYQVLYHIVWGTKYRRKVLKHYVRKEMIESLYKLQRSHPDWYYHEINTDEDHVHMMIEIPPKYSVSKVVQEMKVYSSRWLREKFKFINRIYEGKEGIWSVGYFGSTVGLNEKQIRRYIERQGGKDKGIDVSKEFE